MTEDRELRQEMVALIPRLRRFAHGLCGNPTDAEDLVQIGLEKALSRLHQFKRGTRLDSWLFRIVQTSFLDDRRKASRREDGMDEATLERLPATQTQHDSSTPMGLRDIDRVLATLPEDHRVLLILVLVEGYSYQEAAEITETPIGTVMSRLSRGRKAFAAAYKEATHV